MEEHIQGLADVYQISRAKNAQGHDLLRLTDVLLPQGCQPPSTPVLLLVEPGQSVPKVYVKPGIKLPNGANPDSTTVVNIEGESWLQFSYKLQTEASNYSWLSLVAAYLGRFAKDK